MDKLFEKVKIKMVMKLRGVSHRDAVKLIRLGNAAEDAASKEKSAEHNASRTGLKNEITLEDGEDLLSAEEFFNS